MRGRDNVDARDRASDAELLKGWRAGDVSMGHRLFARHYATVRRFFDLNAGWVAEDLTQRTFLACLESVAKIRDVDVFRAFLLGVARRQLAMFLRSDRRQSLASFSACEDAVARATGLSTLVARRRDQAAVLQALAALPRWAQSVVALYYWDGMRTPELARAYDVTQSAIRSRLARARERLRERLQSQSGDDHRVVPSDEELAAIIRSLVATEPPA